MREYLLRTGGAFEPAAIEQMSGAFDDALAAIRAHPENYVIPDPCELFREAVAKEIVATAKWGEIDRDRLCQAALLAFRRGG